MHILMRGHRKQGTEGTQCAFFMFIRDFVVFWRKLFYESSGGKSYDLGKPSCILLWNKSSNSSKKNMQSFLF